MMTAGLRSLSCPCDSCQNPVIPVESSRIWWNYFWQSPAKIAIPGTIYSSGIEPFCNWDWNGPGMDWNRLQWNAVCINDKSTMHTPSGMFSSHRGVHRTLKMTWQWVLWVHRPRIKSCDLAVIFITFEFQTIYTHNFIYLHIKVYFFI